MTITVPQMAAAPTPYKSASLSPVFGATGAGVAVTGLLDGLLTLAVAGTAVIVIIAVAIKSAANFFFIAFNLPA